MVHAAFAASPESGSSSGSRQAGFIRHLLIKMMGARRLDSQKHTVKQLDRRTNLLEICVKCLGEMPPIAGITPRRWLEAIAVNLVEPGLNLAG
ncbi:MAG: hypothetical protein ACT4QA_19105 [Panacagrimonas sp.]